jgi:hypothetical protein
MLRLWFYLVNGSSGGDGAHKEVMVAVVTVVVIFAWLRRW